MRIEGKRGICIGALMKICIVDYNYFYARPIRNIAITIVNDIENIIKARKRTQSYRVTYTRDIKMYIYMYIR